MAKVDGAMITAKMLKQAGVECIFTLSGGHIYRLFQECEKIGIRVLDTKHEGAAAYAAMSYAQATGKMGVVVATAGPGVTNTLTAIVDSNLYDVPVLLIGGGGSAKQELTETLQDYDVTSIYKQATKFAKRCMYTERIPDFLSTAIRACRSIQPGPVYLEIPLDILEVEQVEEDSLIYPENYMMNTRIAADQKTVEDISNMLIAAKQPAMLIGEGAQYFAEDMTAFKELAEYLQIPTSVTLTNKGKFFKEDKDLFKMGSFAAPKADVVLGFNFKTDMESGLSFVNPDAKWINVTTNALDIGLNRSVDIGVLGYSDLVARQILDCVRTKTAKRESSKWLDKISEETWEFMKELDKTSFESDRLPMHPARIAKEFFDWLNTDGKEWIHSADGGDCLEWIRPYISLKLDDAGAFPNRFFHGTKFGCIGSQMGAVLGLWAATGKPIVHTTGDGSFGQYVGELLTYAKHGMQVITIISNNQKYSMIKGFGSIASPDENNDCGQDISLPGGSPFCYEKYAEVWDGYGEHVEDPDDIIPAINRAVETGKCAIIDVKVSEGPDTYSPGTIECFNTVVV